VEGGVRSREGQGGSGEGRRAAVDVEAIRAAVQAAATYPRLARERGIEGTVVVRFAILADGSVGELAVVGPADEILGEAARAAVRRAAPFASPAGTVKLPVEFSLAAP
jgi:TonB family protein